MTDARILLYRTFDGKFILKIEGEKTVEEFESLTEAIAAARKLRRLVSLTAYDPFGRVMIDATLSHAG